MSHVTIFTQSLDDSIILKNDQNEMGTSQFSFGPSKRLSCKCMYYHDFSI